MTRTDPFPLQSESEQHARLARESERLFLSAMLNDPIEGWNACADAGINHESFADPRHAKLFDVLCAAVVANVTPTPELIRDAMAAIGCPFVNDELRELWLLEMLPTGLDVWAGQVAFYAGRRRQHLSLLQEASDVLSDIAPDATTVVPIRLKVAAA